MSDTVTRLEAMEILGCKKSKFYSLIAEGKLPQGGGFGKIRRWNRAAVVAVSKALMPSPEAERKCIARAFK